MIDFPQGHVKTKKIVSVEIVKQAYKRDYLD